MLKSPWAMWRPRAAAAWGCEPVEALAGLLLNSMKTEVSITVIAYLR